VKAAKLVGKQLQEFSLRLCVIAFFANPLTADIKVAEVVSAREQEEL
jgi:hypothetical protein